MSLTHCICQTHPKYLIEFGKKIRGNETDARVAKRRMKQLTVADDEWLCLSQERTEMRVYVRERLRDKSDNYSPNSPPPQKNKKRCRLPIQNDTGHHFNKVLI